MDLESRRWGWSRRGRSQQVWETKSDSGLFLANQCCKYCCVVFVQPTSRHTLVIADHSSDYLVTDRHLKPALPLPFKRQQFVLLDFEHYVIVSKGLLSIQTAKLKQFNNETEPSVKLYLNSIQFNAVQSNSIKSFSHSKRNVVIVISASLAQ